jgi:hypothetical protein
VDIKGSKIFRGAPSDLSYVGMTVQDCVGVWADSGGCSMKRSQGGKLEHGRAASRFVASSYEIQNSVVVVVVFTMTQMWCKRGVGNDCSEGLGRGVSVHIFQTYVVSATCCVVRVRQTAVLLISLSC